MRVLMLITVAMAIVALSFVPGTTAHDDIDVRVTYGGADTNNTVAYKGDTLDFYIWVLSDYEYSPLTFKIRTESMTGYNMPRALSNSSMTLNHSEEDYSRLTIYTPRVTDIEEYVVRVIVTAEEDESITESVQITIEVIDRIDRGITVEMGDKRLILKPGKEESILVTIDNEYNYDREIVITAHSSSEMVYASIYPEHTLRAGKSLELLLFVTSDEPERAFISVHIVTEEMPEFPVWRHVNVTVVEDKASLAAAETSTGLSINSIIIGFTIGYLIALFFTVLILKDRMGRY